MGNSYSAPNFNVDTPGTTITALETLKGSAIAESDLIYFYGGATDEMLILDKSFICKQIIRGRTSAGAAIAGKRGGIMVINRGIMIESLGDATNTNSGFNSNPTSPDASSLGEAIRHDGDYSTVWTRKGDTYLSTSRFTFEIRYGWLNVRKLVVRNTHLAVISNLGTNATRTDNNHIFDQCDVTLAAGVVMFLHIVNISVKIIATRMIVRQQGAGGATLAIIQGSGVSPLVAGGEIDVSNYVIEANALNNTFSPISFGAGVSYGGCCKASFADNRKSYTKSFHLDKTAISTSAGTLITVTLPDGGGNIMTGMTIDGVACTDRTILSDTSVTYLTPILTAGVKNVVGSFTNYDDNTLTNAITVQAGASAPGAFTISAKSWGTLQSKITINPSAGALRYYVYRDGVLIPDLIITDSYEYIDTTSAGEHTYQVKAENVTGLTSSNTVTVDVYTGKTVGSAWTAFKNQLQNDSALSSYVHTFKFNRQEYNFTNRKDFPLVICFPEDVIKEVVVSMPKRKLASLTVNVYGKLYGIKGDDIEDALIAYDELLKNAIEKDLTLSNTATELNVSESKFSFLDKEVAEVHFTVELLVKRFVMGSR